VKHALLLALTASLCGCATAGSAWMAEPLEPGVELDEEDASSVAPGLDELRRADAAPAPRRAKEIVRIAPEETTSFGTSLPPGPHGHTGSAPAEGRLLGVFRNTYYDFPNERDFSGKTVELKNASCQTIREVPETFYDALCVQGSGTLASGETASFAKRDCGCARVCPRTGQQICFDTLSRQDFPWGRGAQGTPITPLLTVAVDSKLLPLGTAIYIPEYDGVPRDEAGTPHDGCFIAQDRGMKVQGQHVDVFTGLSAVTKLWNRHVPSNAGVHVYVDTARCSRASVSSSAMDL
jgi:3D (Asp-Asp-Asp) domain-containing protein